MSTHASDGADFDLKWHQILLDHWRSELQAGHYLTNDIIELTGGFTGNLRFLRINGGHPMRINRAEFQILAMIMPQTAGTWIDHASDDSREAIYLTGQEIISAGQVGEEECLGQVGTRIQPGSLSHLQASQEARPQACVASRDHGQVGRRLPLSTPHSTWFYKCVRRVRPNPWLQRRPSGWSALVTAQGAAQRRFVSISIVDETADIVTMTDATLFLAHFRRAERLVIGSRIIEDAFGVGGLVGLDLYHGADPITDFAVGGRFFTTSAFVH
jgi:hypothetical protein